MQTLSQTSLPSIVSDEAPILSDEVQMSAISWAAIAAGAIASAALTLLFIAFGAGIGLSAVSPWSDSGVSVTTFKVGTGIYLVCAAIMASSVGGYLAGRLRTIMGGCPLARSLFSGYSTRISSMGIRRNYQRIHVGCRGHSHCRWGFARSWANRRPI